MLDFYSRMTIKFILMVNKQGQTRLAQYYEPFSIEERSALEGEIVRKCLARTENQCSFIEYQSYKCVYRRYASLFFIVGVESHVNELSILEFIHSLVETLDKYFENVCELDVRNSHLRRFLMQSVFICAHDPFKRTLYARVSPQFVLGWLALTPPHTWLPVPLGWVADHCTHS